MMKKIYKILVLGVFFVVLLLNYSNSKKINTNDSNLKLISALAQTSSDWQSMDINCYDQYGNATGKHQTLCYKGGVLATCSGHTDCLKH
jgi:hypothetical protein